MNYIIDIRKYPAAIETASYHSASSYEEVVSDFMYHEISNYIRDHDLPRIEEHIRYADVFGCEDPIKLKDFYQKCHSLFGCDELYKLEKTNLFGKAYYNAARYESKRADGYSIPSARGIFKELSKLLKKLQYAGFIISPELHKYM